MLYVIELSIKYGFKFQIFDVFKERVCSNEK